MKDEISGETLELIITAIVFVIIAILLVWRFWPISGIVVLAIAILIGIKIMLDKRKLRKEIEEIRKREEEYGDTFYIKSEDGADTDLPK